MKTARSYRSSGDPHVVPYLDDFLRKIRRIWMRSFQGREDSVILRDIDSQSYEEDAHEVLLLVVDAPTDREVV